VRLGVARARPGASVNDLNDDASLDALSGTAAFSGLPVEVARGEPTCAGGDLPAGPK
jgi:hypothetical protein